jgi:hypothetical protein
MFKILFFYFIFYFIFSSTIQTDTGTNLTDSTMTTPSQLTRQSSQSEPLHPNREDFKSKLSMSFDDDELDPEKRSMNVSQLAFRLIKYY